MERVFKDGTIVAQTEYLMTHFLQSYKVTVEDQFRKGLKGRKPKQLTIVKDYWDKDPTGDKPFPKDTTLYDRRDKPTEACYYT